MLKISGSRVVYGLSSPPLSDVDRGVMENKFRTTTLVRRLLGSRRTACRSMILRPIGVVGQLSASFCSAASTRVRATLGCVRRGVTTSVAMSSVIGRMPLSHHLLRVHFGRIARRSVRGCVFGLEVRHFTRLLLTDSTPVTSITRRIKVGGLGGLSHRFGTLGGISPGRCQGRCRAGDCRH